MLAECGEAVSDESEEDEPDCPTPHRDNVHLKHLCSQLRRDLKNILLFTDVDCQVLIASETHFSCNVQML